MWNQELHQFSVGSKSFLILGLHTHCLLCLECPTAKPLANSYCSSAQIKCPFLSQFSLTLSLISIPFLFDSDFSKAKLSRSSVIHTVLLLACLSVINDLVALYDERTCGWRVPGHLECSSPTYLPGEQNLLSDFSYTL